MLGDGTIMSQLFTTMRRRVSASHEGFVEPGSSKLFSTGPPGARCEPPGPEFVCFRDSTRLFLSIGLGTQVLNSKSNTCHNKSNRQTRNAKQIAPRVSQSQTSIHKSFLNATTTNLAHAHTPPPQDGAV